MIFADPENLKKLSSCLIRLGYLMAGGDPEDQKSQKQISTLAFALEKIDLKARLIENMRYFHETCLTESQKLKIYEVLLQTVGRPQQFVNADISIKFRKFMFQEKERMCRKKLEQTTGMWTGFALSLGAVIAAPSECSKNILNFGVRFGVALQMLSDLEDRVQTDEQCLALQNAEAELDHLLSQFRSDFQIPEASMAFQLAQRLGRTWSPEFH